MTQDAIPGMSRAELEKVVEYLRATGFLAFDGECWLKSWKKSTHTALPEVTLNLPIDEEMAPFERATVKKGKQAGQRYIMLAFEVGDDEQLIPQFGKQLQVKPRDPEPPRYGEFAKALRLSSFLRSPQVWSAIGSDDQFQAWVRTRMCIKCGERPVEYAHVRSVSEGAGTGTKPGYCGIPLCFDCHEIIQHTQGICKLTGISNKYVARDKLLEWRMTTVQDWVWHELKRILGYDHWNQVPPNVLLDWALRRNLAHLLPHEYQEVA